MHNDPSVVADPANGVVVVAGERLAMGPTDAAGAIRFGGPAGTTLHPLTFSQRTQVVAAAAAQHRATDAVAAAVLAAATTEPGGGDRTLLEVLALWLAGADCDAPNFAETTVLVARGSGWSPRDLLYAPAAEVDRLAVYLDEQQRGSEWKELIFAPPPADSPAVVRARFANQLLRRSVTGMAVQLSSPMPPAAETSDSATRTASDAAVDHNMAIASGNAAGVTDDAPVDRSGSASEAQAAAESEYRARPSPSFRLFSKPGEAESDGEGTNAGGDGITLRNEGTTAPGAQHASSTDGPRSRGSNTGERPATSSPRGFSPAQAAGEPEGSTSGPPAFRLIRKPAEAKSVGEETNLGGDGIAQRDDDTIVPGARYASAIDVPRSRARNTGERLATASPRGHAQGTDAPWVSPVESLRERSTDTVRAARASSSASANALASELPASTSPRQELPAFDDALFAIEHFAPPRLFATTQVSSPEPDLVLNAFDTPVPGATSADAFDLARALAAMLDDEADLRGVDR
jgi:hypothetical protein